MPDHLRPPERLNKVKQLSDALMAKGPGKRPRLVFNIQKNKLNVNKGDIVLQDDGLYKCTEVNRGSGCCSVCKVTLLSWDPKNANGKVLVNKKRK